jgi:nucleoside-diphosphate-sugar epimerase
VLAPLAESAPLRERWYPYRDMAPGPDDMTYSYEKILVERAAQSAPGVAATVLRLPMVYGPGDRQRRVQGYVERLRRELARLALAPAEAAWRCTRGYVEDVAAAVALAASDERAAGQVFNVGEADALSEREWVAAIAAATGWAGEIVTDPSTPPQLPANWAVPLVMDTRRLRDLLGFAEPVGRAEGLRRIVRDATSDARSAATSDARDRY